MPTADRYARYRADQTTIWVSKTAAAFLSRERTAPSEGVAAVLDRLLSELRKLRRGTSAAASGATSGTRTKTARAASRGTATRSTATRSTARAGTAAGGTRRR